MVEDNGNGNGNGQPFRVLSNVERIVKLEERMTQSTQDRREMRTRLNEVESNLSDQIRTEATRVAYMDMLKWGAALIMAAIGGYFFDHLSNRIDTNERAIEQHQK